MIDAEDCEAIERGKKHCVAGHDDKGHVEFICNACKGSYALPMPCELWVTEGIAWAFCKEHADCGEEDEQ